MDDDSSSPSDGDAFETTFDGTPSNAIANSIAVIEDTPPTEMDIILWDYIDPDALDEILTCDGGRNEVLEIEFNADKYSVQVSNNGVLRLETIDDGEIKE